MSKNSLENQNGGASPSRQGRKLVIPTTVASPPANDIERMIQGQQFNFWDPDLHAGRIFADALLKRLNNAEDPEELEQITRDLVGTLEAGARIDPPFTCAFGANIHLGKRAFLSFGCTVMDGAAVRIGDRVMVGPNVSIYTGTHHLDLATRRNPYALPVTIAEDCWIGGGAIILPGASIGEGSVVATVAVVTKDVPPYTVVGG